MNVTAIRDAATVIVARDQPEGLHVFLVRRSPRAGWLADVYVFPGGAVDAADRTTAGLLTGSAGALDPGFVVAAARETFEEAGLLLADRPVAAPALAAARADLRAGTVDFAGALARLGVRIDAERLRWFSHWITPPSESRRFDTRFFVARMPDDQVAEADAAEVHDGRWMRPADALAAHERGEIALIFPTIKHLARIAAFAHVDALLDFARRKAIVTVSPDVRGANDFALDAALEDAW